MSADPLAKSCARQDLVYSPAMTMLFAAFDPARQFHRSGDLQQAESRYRHLPRPWPGQPDNVNRLGRDHQPVRPARVES